MIADCHLKHIMPDYQIMKKIQGIYRPGWLINRFPDFKVFHNATSAEVDHFLGGDLYDLRFFY